MEIPAAGQRPIGHRHKRKARGSAQLPRDRAPGGDILARFMAGMTAGRVAIADKVSPGRMV
jgi:hypothetical protein